MCLRCLLYHILSIIAHTFLVKWDFVFIIIVQFMMSANSQIHYGLQIVFVFLYIIPSHYHHCTNLSEYIELIKYLSNIFCGVCVSVIKHILSVIHYAIDGAVCFQLTHFPFDDWRNIYTQSYYHHRIRSMNYYPLFRVRPWNTDICCMSMFLFSLLLSLLHKNIHLPGGHHIDLE